MEMRNVADTQGGLIQSLLSVVYPDMREAAANDLQTILGIERQRGIPSGWIVVPVRATIPMHNAAALAGIYEAPRLVMDDDGYIRVIHAAPDWSMVWHHMIMKTPQSPLAPQAREGS